MTGPLVELTPEQQEWLAEIVEDPVDYAEVFLDADLWEIQQDILRAIDKPRARVAVKGCHASGKTFVAAAAVLWWLARWPTGIVVTTAPTWTSVRRLLWGEIHQATRRSLAKYPIPNETELKIGKDAYAIGLSTTESERFQGFHGKKVLIIIDEAPGVRPAIYEAIEGIRAGGDVRILALGNPTISSGPFFDAFGTERGSWDTFTISAFDTPNLKSLVDVWNKRPGEFTDEELISFLRALDEDELDDNIRPDLTTRRWVLEKWDSWGRHGNALWDGRVMGRFPKHAPGSLLDLRWLEEAKQRTLIVEAGHRLEAGVDVAGPGEDETVVVLREGPNILGLWAFASPDARGDVLACLRPYKDRQPLVKCDTVGMGYYFGQHLKDHGFEVVPVNVGLPAANQEMFKLLRDELYWGLRERFEEGQVTGLGVDPEEELIAQLTAIRYKHDPRGRVVLRSKDEMRSEGVKSPDRADALMLAFANLTGAPMALV